MLLSMLFVGFELMGIGVNSREVVERIIRE